MRMQIAAPCPCVGGMMFWLLREVSFPICLYSGSGFFFFFWTILTAFSRTYGYQRTPHPFHHPLA